jgi:hypothetical protein
VRTHQLQPDSKMKRYTALCMAFLCFGKFHAQEYTDLSKELFLKEMRPVIEKMSQSNSKLTFRKEIFKDVHSNELISSSKGVIYSGTGKSFRMESDGITIIQSDDIYVLIDSAEHIVQLAKPDSSFNPSASLANFKLEALSKFKLSSFQTDTYSSYKVVPENLSEGIIEYQVDRKTNMLYRFKVSYPPANYFSEDLEDETLEEPYAVMVYEPLQKIKNPEAVFDLSKIIVKQANGDYLLAEQMTNYELHDSRFKSTNE